MSKILGVICPPFTGHINPMMSLSLELKRRGHNIILYHYNNINCDRFTSLGISTVALCSSDEGKAIGRDLDTLSKLVGWRANYQTVCIYEKLAKINLSVLPQRVEQDNCNCLVIDQTLFEGETIASVTKLPFITICNALILNPDPDLPPPLKSWQPNSSSWGKIRNLFGYAWIGSWSGKSLKVVEKYREANKLNPYPSKFTEEFYQILWSSTAMITQQPAGFEFPRVHLGNNFYFTSPFIEPEIRNKVDFPWERLNGKPIVYASLGTLQNSVKEIYNKIILACQTIDCQLVLALGKDQSVVKIENIPSDTIVVDYAPQLEILEKAKICITHAGINTVLESLSFGVPLVAIPIANDQPGIGARINFTKTGIVLNRKCQINSLRLAIKEVLTNNIYQLNVIKIQRSITDGTIKAADIIENKLMVNV